MFVFGFVVGGAVVWFGKDKVIDLVDAVKVWFASWGAGNGDQ